MADTKQVTIPGTKTKVSKPVAAGAVGLVGIGIIYYYTKQKKASAAVPAATSTNQYPPDGTTGDPSDPYSTDPATGQTYGDEAVGSNSTLGAYGSGAASGQYYDPTTGAYDLSSPYGTSPTTQPYQTTGGPPFSNNSAWSDWVIQELQAQNFNIDVGALTDAIGLYLNGQPVDATQAQYVFNSRAIGGDPPVAGTNGYPPNLRTNGSTGGGSGNGTGTIQVPNIVGLSAGQAHDAIVAAGLVPTQASGGHASDIVTSQNPTAGTNVAVGSTVTIIVANPSTGGSRTPPPANWKFPAPSGLRVSSVSNTGYSLSWNPVTGPQGQKPSSYTVATYQTNGVKVDQFISGSTSTKEYGAGGKGLHPGWSYHTNVWANGGPESPANASVSVTLK